MCFYRQLVNWMFGYFTLSRGGPEPKTCGSVHCGSLLVKKDEHLRKDERMKGQNGVIKSFHGTAIAWPGVGSCPERDLHCGAQLLLNRLRR